MSLDRTLRILGWLLAVLAVLQVAMLVCRIVLFVNGEPQP